MSLDHSILEAQKQAQTIVFRNSLLYSKTIKESKKAYYENSGWW